MSNFWVNAFPASVPGAPAYGGGGGMYNATDALVARDPLDGKRMAAGFAPGASYPDGYLGSQPGNRQSDKIMGAIYDQNKRSYVRGVHKGERTDPGSYMWNSDMDPMMGLARQSVLDIQVVEGGVVMFTERFAPTGDPVERLAHDGKTAMMSKPEQEAALRTAGADPAKNPISVVSPTMRAKMAEHLPRWSGVNQA